MYGFEYDLLQMLMDLRLVDPNVDVAMRRYVMYLANLAEQMNHNGVLAARLQNNAESWADQELETVAKKVSAVTGKSLTASITLRSLVGDLSGDFQEVLKIFFTEGYKTLTIEQLDKCAKEFRRLKDAIVILGEEVKGFYLNEYSINDLENGTGWFLVSSVEGLSREDQERSMGKGFVSASLLNTEKPEWYLQEHRHVLVIYELTKQNLIGMSECDCTSNGVNARGLRDDACFEYCTQSLLLDYGIPKECMLSYNPLRFSAAIPFNKIKDEGELLLRTNSKPLGVIVDKNYDLEKDVKGVRFFAGYNQIPEFSLKNTLEPVG